MSNVQLKGNNPTDPWWVIEGSAGEIVQQISQVFPDIASPDPHNFPSVVAKARELWAAQINVGAVLGGTEVRTEQAPGFQQAPASSPAPQVSAGPVTVVGGRICQHGAMVQRSGNKNGRPWSGWFCPLPQDRKSEQCPPVFNK